MKTSGLEDEGVSHLAPTPTKADTIMCLLFFGIHNKDHLERPGEIGMAQDDSAMDRSHGLTQQKLFTCDASGSDARPSNSYFARAF